MEQSKFDNKKKKLNIPLDQIQPFDSHPLFTQNKKNGSSLFWDYFRILRRRKWIVIICVIAASIASIIKILISTPKYEAEASISYKKSNDNPFSMSPAYYDNHEMFYLIELIKSRTLAEEVANDLPTEILHEFVLAEDKKNIYSKNFFIIWQLQANLNVNYNSRSNIIKIKVQASAPTTAKIIVNSYVDRIIQWNYSKKQEDITNTLNFVEKQILFIGDSLQTVEKKLQDFKEKNIMVSIDEASSELLGKFIEAEVAFNQTKTEREVLEERKNYLEQKKQELGTRLNVTYSPLAKRLKNQLVDLEQQVSSFHSSDNSETQKKKNSESLNQRINTLKDELVQELIRTAQTENIIDPLSRIRELLQESISIEVDLETYRAQEEEMKKSLDNYNSRLRSLPKQKLELARLIRTKDVNDKIYSMLLEKREELRIMLSGKVGDIHIIDTPEEPIFPIAPKKKKILALGFAIGFSLGIGIIVFLEFFDNSIRSEEDVRKTIDLPIIASIPQIDLNYKTHFLNEMNANSEKYLGTLLSQFENESYIYEAYRSLQLNMNLVNREKPLKSVLITSALPGEGKTYTAINLALIYAKSGAKTLLFDCDLRKPSIYKIFNIKQKPGISDALVDNTLFFHENKNLFILTHGTRPPNPSEILNSNRFKEIFEEMKKDFDLIILDSPPIIPITDSIILGNIVDVVYFVIKSGKTRQDAAMKAKQILENCYLKIDGVILNNVNLKDTCSYYKDYYFYYRDGKKKKKQFDN